MIRTLLAAAAISALWFGAAQASTVIYASDAEIIEDGPRGETNDRDNIENAYGAPDGDFFELGYGATVDFYFDSDFTGPSGSVVEITNGNADNWLEGVIVQVGNTVDDVFTSLATVTPDVLLNTGDGTFTFSGGPFNTIRLIDVTCDEDLVPGGKCDTATGGFDVDSIGVMAVVPLPAAGLMLLTAIGGIAALRRRKAAAAA